MPGIRVSAAHMPAVCKLVLREAEGSAKKKVPGRNIKPRILMVFIAVLSTWVASLI